MFQLIHVSDTSSATTTNTASDRPLESPETVGKSVDSTAGTAAVVHVHVSTRKSEVGGNAVADYNAVDQRTQGGENAVSNCQTRIRRKCSSRQRELKKLTIDMNPEVLRPSRQRSSLYKRALQPTVEYAKTHKYRKCSTRQHEQLITDMEPKVLRASRQRSSLHKRALQPAVDHKQLKGKAVKGKHIVNYGLTDKQRALLSQCSVIVELLPQRYLSNLKHTGVNKSVVLAPGSPRPTLNGYDADLLEIENSQKKASIEVGGSVVVDCVAQRTREDDNTPPDRQTPLKTHNRQRDMKPTVLRPTVEPKHASGLQLKAKPKKRKLVVETISHDTGADMVSTESVVAGAKVAVSPCSSPTMSSRFKTTSTSTTEFIHMSRAMRMVAQANINNQAASIVPTRRVASCDRSPLIAPPRECYHLSTEILQFFTI